MYAPECVESRLSALVRPFWFGVRKEKVKGEGDLGGVVRRWVRIWAELSICKGWGISDGHQGGEDKVGGGLLVVPIWAKQMNQLRYLSSQLLRDAQSTESLSQS